MWYFAVYIYICATDQFQQTQLVFIGIMHLLKFFSFFDDEK